tara:strand:- start:584 stop:910 length:327 start_codon:yes stop_codon:yes gene_type:complete
MTEPQNKKRIVFYEIAKTQADLKIKLNYDGLSQSEFFRLIIRGYLEDDDRILGFLENYKKENNVYSSKKRSKSASITKKQKQEIKKYSLDGTDIEDIFDIIAEEHPDL